MRLPLICLSTLLLFATSAFATVFKPGDHVEVMWSGTWYKGKILTQDGDHWRVGYDGYGSNWDESVTADRLRTPAAAAASNGNDPATTTALPFPERPPGKAGIEGAFLRIVTGYFSGRLSLTLEGWFFTSNGRVSLSPAHGFDFTEFRNTQVAHKQDGSYGIVGDKLTVAWAAASKPEVSGFQTDGDNIVLNGIAAVRASAFKPSWRVEAIYEGGSSVGGSGSYVANSNSLELHADGTFGGASVGSISATSSGSTISGGSTSNTRGTYVFDAYTLTLNHADGRVERFTVFPFGEISKDGTPAQIWREGTMLHRRDNRTG